MRSLRHSLVILGAGVLLACGPGTRAPSPVSPATLPPAAAPAPAAARVSAASDECLGCHRVVTPGIVGDWERSRHARRTVREALGEPELARRVSAADVPASLLDVVVGCAECHTSYADQHPDTVDHAGYAMHVVVSPRDCATCHPVEVDEYDGNLMSRAHGNLRNNPLFHGMMDQIAGARSAGSLEAVAATDAELGDACYYCHGTEVKVVGRETRDEMEFAILSGWPNQGVGRINPDGTRGACTACHPRHEFSIEVARSPETCAECHAGPDVPAFAVYQGSKHGAIFAARGGTFDLGAVPWTVGRDLTAPTCATCHMSLLVSPDGDLLAKRTHRMSDRLPWRLFGLPYAHPFPRSPDTTGIRNSAGLQLPTELDGTPVAAHVIDQAEVDRRLATMKGVCAGCHATSWVRGHFERLQNTIQTTNAATRVATDLVAEAWRRGLARGPAQGGNPFDEVIERMWMRVWLFYANSARLASAMGNGDYGVFGGGRFQLTETLAQMREWLDGRKARVRPRPGR